MGEDEQTVPKRRLRWPRRFYIAALVVLALALVSRLVVIFALPPVIRQVAEYYGLHADFERMELYLIGGDVGVWHFSLTPAEGGKPIVQSDYTRIHISTWDLLRGRLTVRRLESEGVDVEVQRRADGRMPLLERFAHWTRRGRSAASPAPGQPTVGPEEIDLNSPLEIDAFRLSNIHAHLVDNYVSPPLDAMVGVNLRLADLDSTVRPTRFEMDMTGSPILDLLHVDGTGTAGDTSLEAVMQVEAKGLHPIPAAGYLAEAGIRPTTANLAISLNAHLQATDSDDPDAIAVTVQLDHMNVTADGETAAALDSVRLDADPVNATTAHVTQITVDGGRCQLQRNLRGEIGAAGLQVIQPAVLERALEVPLSEILALIPQHWSVGKLTLRNLSANLDDLSLASPAPPIAATPPASPASPALSLKLSELTLSSFSPEHPNDVTTIQGRLAAPGIAGDIQLDGKFRPFAATKEADLTVAVNGIRPDALRPYLDDWGLQSDFTDGTFTTALHVDVTPSAAGALATNASLSKLALRDGDELLSLDSVGLSGAAYDPASGRLHIRSIDIAGPHLATGREISGGLAALGLHTKPRRTPDAAMVGPGVGPAVAAALRQYALSLPKLRIDHFAWKAIGIDFKDRALTPNSKLAISDAGLELSDLNLNFDPNDPAGQPGKLHAWLSAPNLARSIVVDGALNTSADGISADLTVDGSGVTSSAVAGYFENRRVRPRLRDGAIHFTTHLAAEKTASGLEGTLAVNDLAYRDGTENLATVDLARAGGVSLRDDELKIEQMTLHSPRIWISREADGSLVAGGVRLLPEKVAARAADRLAEIYQTPAERAAARAANGWELPWVSTLDTIQIDDASIQWADRKMHPAVSAHLTATIHCSDLVVGNGARPAKFMAAINEESALDRLTMTGTITPSPPNPAAVFAVEATGIHTGALAAYLGPNIRMNVKDGRFDAVVDAAANQIPSGGYGGHLLVKHFDYRDGAGDGLLCRFDALRLAASRIDPAGKKIAIDEIGVDGLEMPATRCKDGTIRLLGVNLSRPGSAAPATAAPASTVNVSGVGIANLASVANEKYPLVTVDKLDIGARAIAISDEYRPDAVALTLADLHLTNRARIEVLGDNPQTGPPVDLMLTGAADPLIGSMNIHAVLTPFSDPAVATITVEAAGIHGAGVTDLLPGLKSEIDGGTLTDGRLTGQIAVQLTQPRTDPLGLDLARDFGVELSLKDVELKDGATGRPLGGVGEVLCEDIQCQPRNSTVVAKDIEISNPSASVFRDASGVHVLGLLVKPLVWRSALAVEDSAPPTSPATSAASPASAILAAATTPKPDAGEFAVGKLLVSGLDFKFEDSTCDPPLLVPLNGLDVDVRGLSSRMIDEDMSCRFSALVNAGKVSLPGKNPSGLEDRDLFSQAEASGIVSLYPYRKGWVKSSINALDLAAFSGEARQAGVNLGGGTFDGTADLRLNGDGSMDLRSRLSLTDLELTEPPNGPIVRYLNVGSPLNVVIAALQDQDGSITLPIDVPIRSGHISSGDIALAATGAVASVVTTAVATTPLKASDSVLALFGDQKLPKNEQPVTLNFDPADPTLSLQDLLTLRALLEQARTDPTLEMALHHVLGGGDAQRAGVLANPSRQDSENLAYSLRLKKIALLAARDAAAQRAAAQIASGFGADSNGAIEQLRNIDLSLATTENAMDAMYDMLRPGADRQAGRRTRAACVEIAQDRLLAVRDALLASGIPNIEQQIKVAHATFNEASGASGGQVVIVLSHRKNQ